MRALVTLAPVLARIQPGHGADWDMKLDHAMRPRARMARSSPRRLLNTSCRRLDIAADASRTRMSSSTAAMRRSRRADLIRPENLRGARMHESNEGDISPSPRTANGWCEP